MNPVQEVIKAFDEEIINKGLPYLNLQQSNKLLVDKGLMTISEKSKQQLKKLLEGGDIQHASQTTQSPKQWRIPLSKAGREQLEEILQGKKGKKVEIKTRMTFLRQQGFDTRCPNCYQELKLSLTELDDNRLLCPNCFNNFKNPYRGRYKSIIEGNDLPLNNPKFASKKSRQKRTGFLDMNLEQQKKLAWGLVIGTIVFISILGVLVSGPTPDYIKSARAQYKEATVCNYEINQIIQEYGNFYEAKVSDLSSDMDHVIWTFRDNEMEWSTIYNSTMDCYFIQTITRTH